MTMPAVNTRIPSIDVFRALTMLLMIFVNDLWTLKGIPGWLEHSPADVDFLGLADVVFPCFLFILGMAIPFATENRIAKGQSKPTMLKHIILRSVALLIMGVFTVNTPELNAAATGISDQWYEILMVTAFFLVWNVYPKASGWKKYLFTGLQIVGVAILIWLAIIYRGETGNSGQLTGFIPRWWGILGLIGWSYLVGAVIYLFARKYFSWIVGAWAFFTLFNIAGHAGWLHMLYPAGPREWFVGNGAFYSFTLAGMIGALLLKKYYTPEKQNILLLIFLALGVLMLVAGLISREFFIISKIRATATWIFLCCAIAYVFYAFLHWLVDRKEKGGWFHIIWPAGTNTLTCYLIPYFYYNIAVLSGIALPEAWKIGAAGLLKSLIFSFVIIGITAVLDKLHIKLKI